MKTHRCLTIVLLLTSTVFAADQQEPTLSGSAQRTADKMRKEILAEVKRLGHHDWAGDYYEGDGLGANILLAVAPKSGYVFEWHGCLGLYGRNYGTTAWTNSRIKLSFTYENKPGFGGIAPEFIPVSWKSRRYLVPADDIIGFCNNVNMGREPRMNVHGSYLLRRGDEKRDVAGFPEVPNEYRPYLLAEPVEAKIIAVGPYTTRPSITTWKFKDTPVTLDAGTSKGLRVGMELVVTQPQNTVESVRVTKVEADRAEGMMTQAGEEERDPKTGWRLSTRAPWYEAIRKKSTTTRSAE